MRFLLYAFCLIAALLGALPVWAVGEAASSACRVTLQKAMPGGKDVTLHLGLRGTAIAAAFATGYTGRGHDVDAKGLAFDGTRLTGTVSVTITPDDYVLAVGKTLAGRYTLDATVADGAVTGTYGGATDGAAVAGALAGTVAPQTDAGAKSRFRVRMCHVLQRAWRQKGSNYKYALDFNLVFSIAKGVIPRVQIETIVPDYRRYCVIVTKQDLRLEGFALTGTVEAMIDTGEQGGKGAGTPREEPYVFTVNALVIGDTVAGTYDEAIGMPGDKVALVTKGLPLLGGYTIGDPPKPEASVAWLRLHKAMGNDLPVLLDLSIVDGKKLHGLAFVSGYNHMPHPVDCAGLKREGDHIAGRIVVDVQSDCFGQTGGFAVDLLVDARIQGEDVTGVFASIDRGKPFTGVITGETRAKRVTDPPVTAANLATVELTLGAGFPPGKLGMGSPVVRLTVAGGTVVKADVAPAEAKGEFEARIVAVTCTLDGDRLTGSIAFTAVTNQVAEGKYAYSFAAIVNGDSLWGYWSGTCNGKPILVKSAKLGGKLTAKP
jgi:hypothetical protein